MDSLVSIVQSVIVIIVAFPVLVVVSRFISAGTYDDSEWSIHS